MARPPLVGQAGMQLNSVASGSPTDVHVELDDGRVLSIEMIDDNEIGFVVRDTRKAEHYHEIIWSEVLDA